MEFLKIDIVRFIFNVSGGGNKKWRPFDAFFLTIWGWEFFIGRFGTKRRKMRDKRIQKVYFTNIYKPL